MRTALLLALLSIPGFAATTQQAPQSDRSDRPEGVVKRGEHVMGFFP
jgi:hypothetical protein